MIKTMTYLEALEDFDYLLHEETYDLVEMRLNAGMTNSDEDKILVEAITAILEYRQYKKEL